MKNNELKIKLNGKIIKYKVMKRAVKFGTSCHVLLPIQLSGKVVEVRYGFIEDKVD